MSLFICPTPIGNLKDITLRTIEVLKSVDLILAEDTRVTRKLLQKFEIETPLSSFHSYNEKRKTEYVIKELKNGKNIAIVSDSGMPCISDPGSELVKACIDNGINVEALPGPTSFVTALILSGFSIDHFTFYGFLPRKKGKRRKIIEEYSKLNIPVVYFESPFRVKEFLQDVIESVGDRNVALVREISKIYEEVIRGKASDILKEVQQREIKGEVIFIVDKE